MAGPAQPPGRRPGRAQPRLPADDALLGRGRRVRLLPRDPRVPGDASVLGDRGQAPGPLPLRPGASRPFHHRRRRRRVPPRHDRRLGAARRLAPGGPAEPEHLRADHVLGAGHLHPAARADGRAPRLQAGAGLRAEHADRRRRRGRPADRPQARQAPRVRRQRRRLHRPRPEGPPPRPSRAPGDPRRPRAAGGHRQVPGRRARGDRVLQRAGVGAARRCCASFAPSRSRSIWCRACSSSSVLA